MQQIEKFYNVVQGLNERYNYASMYMETTSENLKVRLGPAGLHLFNRKSGMNVLVDEIRPPSHLWSTAPRQVSIALTNICDLACAYCYAPKNSSSLNLDHLKEWLIDLDSNGCFGVGFGGGEPTLYPQLVDLFSFVTKKTRLAVTMTTHAHHLTDSLLNDLNGNINFIRVSMDGTGKNYELIRGRSFAKLVDRITALSFIAPFGINFVVNSQTIVDLDSALHLADRLGASEFLLLPEEPTRGRAGIDEKTFLELRKWTSKYSGKVPLLISERRTEGFSICNPLIEETGLAAYAHINAEGFFKATSYNLNGVQILNNGVIDSLNKLKILEREVA